MIKKIEDRLTRIHKFQCQKVEKFRRLFSVTFTCSLFGSSFKDRRYQGEIIVEKRKGFYMSNWPLKGLVGGAFSCL